MALITFQTIIFIFSDRLTNQMIEIATGANYPAIVITIIICYNTSKEEIRWS